MRRKASAEQAELSALLAVLDDASGSARIAWLFFLALLAYLLVAMASVSHKDLLLNNPVQLPFLGISIALDKFFIFAPIGLLLVHLGLYMQHIILAKKAWRLDELLRERETAEGLPFRQHPMRLRVHSYFFTQTYCGSARGKVFAALMRAMTWVSLVILPAALFLFFQLAFLPYHDNTTTNLHRAYLFADLVIIALMQVYLTGPRRVSLSPFRLARRVVLRMCGTLSSLFLIVFSFFVATFPGDSMEVPPVAPIVTPLTEALFDNGLLQRNLIVTDSDLSIVRTTVTEKREGGAEETTERVKLPLRSRNLSYAKFDRSILSGVDLTDANMEGASLRGADLRGALLSCARRPLRNVFGGVFKDCTKLFRADLEGADLRSADLGGACLDQSNMKSVDLRGANAFKATLRGTDLSFAHMDDIDLTEAKLQGARLLEAELRGASMRFSQLQPQDDFIDHSSECEEAAAKLPRLPLHEAMPNETGATILTRAKLEFADIRLANLQFADLSGAHMIGANLGLAQLQAARLDKADLRGADLSYASLQGADLSEARLDVARLDHARLDGAVLRRAVIQRSHLSGTRLQGADLRFAWLLSADASQADYRAADLRCARLTGALPDGLTDQHALTAHIRLETADEPQGQSLQTLETDILAARAGLEQDRRAKRRRDSPSVPSSDDVPHGASTWAQIERIVERAGFANATTADDNCREPKTAEASPPPSDHALIETLVDDVVCADPLTVRFIAKGVAKRMVDSLEPDLFDVVADPDPATFLKALQAKSIAVVDDPKTPEAPKSCLDAIDQDVLWQLTLAAKLYQVERQKHEANRSP